MTSVIENKKELLEKLHSHTLEDIEESLKMWPGAKNENRIKMVESAVQRYYVKRILITGRQTGPSHKKTLEGQARITRLLKENRYLKLKLELNETKKTIKSFELKRWWKFWS